MALSTYLQQSSPDRGGLLRALRGTAELLPWDCPQHLSKLCTASVSTGALSRFILCLA